MKNKIVKNVKTFVRTFDAKKVAVSSAMMTAMFPMLAYAAPTADVTGIMTSVIGWIFNFIGIVGFFQLLFGIYEFIECMKSENGDKKDQAVKKIAVGGFLLAFMIGGHAFFVDKIVAMFSFS